MFWRAAYWVQLQCGGDLEQFQGPLLNGRWRSQHLQGSFANADLIFG
jgi:hypothetical protein